MYSKRIESLSQTKLVRLFASIHPYRKHEGKLFAEENFFYEW